MLRLVLPCVVVPAIERSLSAFDWRDQAMYPYACHCPTCTCSWKMAVLILSEREAVYSKWATNIPTQPPSVGVL